MMTNRPPRIVLVQLVLLIIVTQVILLVMPFGPFREDRVIHAWWNYAHIPCFALIYVALSMLFLKEMSRIGCGIMVFSIVPIIEWIQLYTGREYSINDMIHGWFGCLAGMLIDYGLRSAKIYVRRIVIGMGLGIILATTWPAIRLTVDRHRIQSAFPVLTGFDSRWVPSRWNTSGCTIEVVEDSGWIARMNSTSEYPGLFLADLVGDWSNVESFSCDVVLDQGSALTAWLRIDDDYRPATYANRFQQSFVLHSGFNQLVLSRKELAYSSGGRVLNLSAISSVGLFFTRESSNRTIQIKRMELTLHDEQPSTRVSR